MMTIRASWNGPAAHLKERLEWERLYEGLACGTPCNSVNHAMSTRLAQ